MFLHLGATSGNTNSAVEQVDGNILTARWRYINKLNADLKNRFRSEYLSLLVEKSNKGNFNTLKVGDIVLIGTDEVKRVQWPLALVLEIYPGADGHCRVARLKTATGERIRALQRLFPLETSAKFLDTVHPKSDDLYQTTRAGRKVKLPARLNL